MTSRNFRSHIENLRERARTSDDISDADAELLIEFSDRMDLLKSDYTDSRHKKLLGNCVRLAEEVGGLAEALEDREAAETLVRYINRTYDNEESNRDYRIALRMFGEHVTDGDGKPDSIDWISSTYSRTYDPAPNPSNMLHWEDHVLPMIDETRNSRDAAIIATAWNLGARPFEFQDITIGDVTDSNHGLQVTVQGKRGQRSPTLVLAVPHLQRWLDDHPAPDDSDAPLWSKLTSPEAISDRMFRKILESAAERADVTRPVTLSNFRKSCASYLASKNVNQAHIEDHIGWKRGSGVAARYVAVFGGESEREIAKAYGAELEEEEPDPIAPVECPRCQRETPRDRDTCMWCNQALDQGAVASIQADQEELRRSVLQLAKENPDILDDIERARDLVTMFEGNPELIGEATDFAEALSNE